MTGFGRAEHAADNVVARVEITSVNRKQADIHFHLPRELAAIEADLRKVILTAISRGRVNVSIQLEATGSAGTGISIDASKAKALATAFKEIGDLINRPVAPEASDFLRAPGIISFEDSGFDPDEARAAIKPALEAAIGKLVEMREAEGDDLKADLQSRLATLQENAAAIVAASPRQVERQRELLHSRLREAGIELDLDDERLLKEIALFAERCDISEETTRLDSHLKRFREYLESVEPVGRSLDFLCQELNRELNTIGSKTNDAFVAQTVVGAKTELEKIREQVQNIE